MASKTRRIAWLAVALALGAPASGQGEVMLQTSNGARYVSGGIGAGERDEMLLMLPDFNLKVITAAQGSGAFLAGVRLVVFDSRGAKVLETTLDGPWLMGRLDPGRYELQVTHGGATQKRMTTLPGKGHRVEHFYWSVPGAETLQSVERQELQPLPGTETLRALERQEQRQVPGGTK
jgi:hypothetical protein